MVALNLPEFEYKLQQSEGKVWIFDVIRKKYVVLTPEEWVRQHLVHYFIHHLQYPKSLVRIEQGLSFNRLQKRPDIVVYNRDGNPWMLAECKSHEVPLDQSSVRQISMYNTTLKATYMVLSNGLKHLCFQVQEGKVEQLKEFPAY